VLISALESHVDKVSTGRHDDLIGLAGGNPHDISDRQLKGLPSGDLASKPFALLAKRTGYGKISSPTLPALACASLWT
jgi:hypothetical protein